MLLVHYLKSLNKSEYESFKGYLSIKSLRTPTIQLSLLTFLGEHIYYSEKLENLTSSNIAIQVFKGNSKSHHNKVNDNASEVLKKLKTWLSHQQLEKEMLWQNLLLTRALSERNMHENFMQTSLSFINQIKETNNQDMDSLFVHLSMINEMYQHPLTAKMTQKNSQLDDSLELLEHFYIINKLRIGIEKKYFRTSFVQEKDSVLLSDWTNFIAKASTLGNNLVFFYLDLINILENPAENETLIQELWHKITSPTSKISAFDLQFLSIALINSCNKLIVKGKKEYYKIYLQIYLYGIEAGYLLENNQISTATFKNISFGLALQQDEKIFEDFIIKYEPLLESQERKNVILLARTYYHCFAKKFDDALDFLNQIQKASIITKYSSYLLQINIFMEQLLDKSDCAELISSKIEAFRQFIKRDEILGSEKKKAYHNYLLLVGNIFNYIYHKKNNGKQKITDQIDTTSPLVARDWLYHLASRIKE